MTVYLRRSANASLDEGATDGKYRKVRPNTTVDDPSLGDDLTRANRRGLHPFFNYGFIDTEEQSKVNPGRSAASAGRVQSTKNTPVFDVDSYMTGQEK